MIKQAKMKRMKASKHKTKMIAKPDKNCKKSLDEENILDYKHRKV